ncbi:chloride channel protein [Salinibius halmophilus]|uniref:chloride channel protein n=1 Tax=Salinibius halmophilus TaxID=1853216 RepID=UPI000E6746BE|nr:chloride channel protein [Salinibius halmophilus]
MQASANTNRLRRRQLELLFRENIPLLTLLGAIVGAVTALVVALFRYLIELAVTLFLPISNHETFEQLPVDGRLLLVIIGLLILYLIQRPLNRNQRQTGVGHVLSMLQKNDGHMPIGNWLNQFFSTCVALVSGLSVGREGPAVHLGAGIGSQLGERLDTPKSSIRILLAAGAASAIAATFNTPLAGVLFAMEVILFEYLIAGFIPIIAAAVTATAVTQWLYGDAPLVALPSITNLDEPLALSFILVGVVVGCASAAHIYFAGWLVRQTSSWRLWQKFAVILLATIAAAIWLPELMGTGSDTLALAIDGQLLFGLLLAIAVGKLLLSSITVCLGVPGGLIGPTLLIGACLGAACAVVASWLGVAHSAAAMAIVGMTAMMGATLFAPLAALSATIELTSSTTIIWPAMLAIVIANLISRYVFQQRSIFQQIARAQGIEVATGKLQQAVNQISVLKLTSQSFKQVARVSRISEIQKACDGYWIIAFDELEQRLLDAKALCSTLEDELSSDNIQPDSFIDLFDYCRADASIGKINGNANLAQALTELRRHNHSGLMVNLPYGQPGLITRKRISDYLSNPEEV